MLRVHTQRSNENIISNNQRSLPLNVAACTVSHPGFSLTVQFSYVKPLPRYSCIWHILFSHHVFIFLPNPCFFWFSKGRSEEEFNFLSQLLRSDCTIRESTLFRTIAVVQRPGNLADTNMISSACPGSWQNAEIVWLLQQRKSLRWKIQHRVVSLQIPLIWQI